MPKHPHAIAVRTPQPLKNRMTLPLFTRFARRHDKPAWYLRYTTHFLTLPTSPISAMTQVLLKGGRVIDPAAGLDATLDILVDGQRIAAIGPDLAATAPIAEIVDCKGRLVLPGLI